MLQAVDNSGVLARLDKLERQNRRMKQAGAVALVLAAAAAVLMGQAGPKRIVEAEQFLLKDSNGSIRGGFAVIGNEPGIELYDRNQILRVVIGLSDGVPNLTLKDDKGVGRASLAIPPLGAGLVLGDSAGKFRMQLDVGAEGPRIYLEDKNGSGISLGNYFSPAGTVQTSAASAILFNKDKSVLWKAP